MNLWIGAAVGAAAMYFLDPQHGDRRRRSALQTYERLRPTIATRMEAAEPAVRDLGERVREVAGRVPGLGALAGGAQGAAPSSDRPALITGLSETQMEELTRQFGEPDRQGWNALTESYGWTTAQADEVWRWFEQQPAPDQMDAAS